MYKQIKELPPLNKPSQLIRVALGDLEVQEKSPNKVISMSDWHKYKSDEQCYICLAGAVICERFDVPDTHTIMPSLLDGKSNSQLEAINQFRRGNVEDGCKILGLKHPSMLLDWVNITNYHISPEDFKTDMSRLADSLEKYGL